MENGNAVDFLKLYPDTDCSKLKENWFACVCINIKFQALDTVQGLEYLHSQKPSIIHGDLKGVSHMSPKLQITVPSPSIPAQCPREELVLLISALPLRRIQKHSSCHIIRPQKQGEQ